MLEGSPGQEGINTRQTKEETTLEEMEMSAKENQTDHLSESCFAVQSALLQLAGLNTFSVVF